MKIESHSLYEETYVPLVASAPKGSLVVDAHNVEVRSSPNLPAETEQRIANGFTLIGTAEFVGRGNLGVGQEARIQAAKVGAATVLVRVTPAKLKAIQKRADGTIDMQSVLADPPAYLSPKGYFVVQANFLASPQ